MLPCSTALRVMLSDDGPSALVGGEPVMLLVLGMLTMPPLVLGREERRAGALESVACCSGTGVVGGDGDQGRWNWPGGRFWNGLGKRSGVAGVESSLCAS